MPPDRFAFLGYFPQKQGKQETLLNEIKGSKESGFIKTFIFYESPHRILDTLSDIQKTLGDIDIVVAREMTKIHEEFYRGKISAAIPHFENPKGEFVLVI
jgi:16S rRNA (cytidine1402-2'-O)-methyltransferase